jgi:hypothetical protein
MANAWFAVNGSSSLDSAIGPSAVFPPALPMLSSRLEEFAPWESTPFAVGRKL